MSSNPDARGKDGQAADRAVAVSGRSPALARRVFLAGFAVAYLVWLVLGVLDTLVWMPQYVAPTTPLDQIYRVLADAGSAGGVVLSPVLWLLFWASVGTAYVVVFLPAGRKFRPVAKSTSLVTVVGVGLVVFGAMSFFQWWSGFPMGMEVSDDLPPGIGASTPFSLFCFTGGFLIALVGGALCAAGATRAIRLRRRRQGAAE